jgi:hypothetical protein
MTHEDSVYLSKLNTRGNLMIAGGVGLFGAGSLIGALANRTNEENQKLYDRMITTMLNKLGYCKTCSQKTIEYFCTQVDES